VEAQDGRSIGGQRSVDLYGSRYCTYRNVNIRLGKVGSEGEEQNLVVSLRFSIIECVRGSYNQCIMGYVRGFVLVKVLGKQIVHAEKVVQPEDERLRLSDRASECLQ
jgi:hypothetical protein